MASRATKPPVDPFDQLPPLEEGPELDALIKRMVEEADADPRPNVPMKEVFDGLRKRHAERLRWTMTSIGGHERAKIWMRSTTG